MRFFIYLLIFLACGASQAVDLSPSTPSQEAKASRRWSLAQWMEQKGKVQWMDLWLKTPYDSSSSRSGRSSGAPWIYDVYIGGDYNLHDRETVTSLTPAPNEGDFRAVGYHAGAFVSVFGLHGRYENSETENRTVMDGLLQLRLFGVSDQASNLTVFYGLHQQEFLDDKVVMPQAGGSLTFYLVNAWAVQARYQHFFEESSDAGNELSGYRFEGTTWVEWGGVRFFGTWFHEPMEYITPAGDMRITRDGVSAGIRVYLDFKK
jgi:hypothetical protein